MTSPLPNQADSTKRSDWLFDLSLALIGVTAVLAPYLGVIALYADLSTAQLVVATLAGLALFAGLVWRRHHPLFFMVWVLIMVAVHTVFVPLPFVGLVTVPVAIHAVTRFSALRVQWPVLVLWVVAAVACPLRWYLVHTRTDEALVITILGMVSFLGVVWAAYAVGRRGSDLTRRRQESEETALDQQRSDLEIEASDQRAADLESRAALADDLHDGLAHAISLILIQAEEAKALVTTHPAQAIRSLDAISGTGRETLTELRRVVRVMRSEDVEEAIAQSPAPSLDDLPQLIEDAGAELTVSGDPIDVDAALGLTIYRIVQEALTNVLTHAGPDADPQVCLDWGADDVEISITNDATDFEGPQNSNGQGLDTMADRVAAVDGMMETGPTDDGGFRVWSCLPYAWGDQAEPEDQEPEDAPEPEEDEPAAEAD
ncbi:MAG: histidine kinase [Propionibacteriaceae bacterium]|nr:histidine kinase [Propionibacteriaceae bacterium]